MDKQQNITPRRHCRSWWVAPVASLYAKKWDFCPCNKPTEPCTGFSRLYMNCQKASFSTVILLIAGIKRQNCLERSRFVGQLQWKTLVPIFRISQTHASFNSTLLLLLLILQLIPAGQRWEKVRPLPLISLYVSVRLKSASFHPPGFQILNGATVLAKVALVCPRRRCCFHPSTVASGE